MMKQIGTYDIIGEIGAGGMAVVYQAVSRDPAAPTVAIKVLPESQEHNPESVKRFELEAKTAQGLQHPNVVRVFDAVCHGSPHYMVMEFLEGGSLAQKLRLGPLPLREAVRCLRQIGGALACAHQQRVVHRDVKPANILFRRNGDAVLIDFGVVRDFKRKGLTVDGSRLGTPLYMSPEQAMGRVIDERTDQYALATVFYEMITGRPPFLGSALEVAQQVIGRVPAPPSSLRSGLPKTLDAILLRALSKAPTKRFPSVTDFVIAVEQAAGKVADPERLIIQDFKARPVPGRRPMPDRRWRRRRMILGVLLALVMMLIMGGVVWLSLGGTQSGGFI